ncbi:extracellular solute-binding protein [Devosia algicola]|uniref:Extracellular solute-binding protein n=1 Tax=Devosia algicola TaxID=3026418 RepID=A0ABY7YLL5_9HYPH|nr:extracellular solute-binding protein [Devosia algicola]WDR02195.1 extracellular solute-binding protein [Devosia algicola]
MLRRTLLTTTATMVLLGALAAPVLAQTTLRLVSKDLLTTNPDDVKEIDAIEAALKAAGTDVDIQIIDMPGAGYADALGVMLLSGDIPDIMYFQGGDQKMAEQGILEELNPWIEKSEYIKDALWPHNVDRLSNYPYLLYVYPPRAPQPVIRQDWLDKLGMEPPTTVEEYEALFQAIHDADLDGDGTPGNTLGLSGYGNTNELDSIFNQAFGVTGTWMKDGSGSWVNSRVTDAEKSKLAFYTNLASKGLFDKEYVTNTYDVKEDKFYTGKAGVIFGSSPEVIDIYSGKMRQAHPGEDITLTLLPVPSGPGGKGLAAVDVSKESRGWAISSISEHKDEAFKVLDFMASKQGQDIDRMGFEGEQYTKDASGAVTFTDQISTWYARFFNAANWTPPTPLLSPTAQAALDTVKADFTPDNAFVWPADYAADVDATEQVYRAWVAKFITGQADLAQWDEFVAEYNAAGGARMAEYAATVLDQ